MVWLTVHPLPNITFGDASRRELSAEVERCGLVIWLQDA